MFALIRYLIVGAMVAAVLTSAALTHLVPALTGMTPINIEGGSMGDDIPYGSVAFVRPASEYREGDVVTFNDGYHNVTHLLLTDADGHGTLWQTKGSANPQPDPLLITNDQIVGRVEFHVVGLGLATGLLAQWYVTGFLMLTAIALLYWPSAKPFTRRLPAPSGAAIPEPQP